MADTKISAFTAVSSLTASDEFPVVQSAANKKSTLQKVLDLVV